MDVPEEFKDFNIGKDPDLEDKIGQPNEYPIVYPGYDLPIIAPGKAVRVRKDVSLTASYHVLLILTQQSINIFGVDTTH